MTELTPKNLDGATSRCSLAIFFNETPPTASLKDLFRSLFPALQSGQRLFQKPPAKGNFLAVKSNPSVPIIL